MIFMDILTQPLRVFRRHSVLVFMMLLIIGSASLYPSDLENDYAVSKGGQDIPFVVAVEVLGMIEESIYIPIPEYEPFPNKHPWVPRIFGGGRGASWTVWLFGRKLRCSVRTSSEVTLPDMTFEEFLDKGFPEEIKDKIEEQQLSLIISAVRRLLPLSCMCSSGANTVQQHGSIRRIVRKKNPLAPIDHSVTIGRCGHCGRGWSFEEMDDSHYSYTYVLTSFPSCEVQ